MIGILKIGHGNIRSLINILERLGAEIKLVSKKDEIQNLSKLILPGVGYFNNEMCELQYKNIVEAIRNHSLEKDIL